MTKVYRWVAVLFTAKTIFIFITVMLCVNMSVSLVFAQSGDSKSNYVTLKGGIYSPTSSDLKGFNTGFNGEVAFGHYFNRYFASELNIGYFQSSNTINSRASSQQSNPEEEVLATLHSTSSSGGGSGSMDIWTVPVTVAVKALYPLHKFEPYVMGGVGVYFANAKFNYSGTFTSGGSTGTASGSATASSTVFGGFLGAGVNYNIGKNWYIGAEGKYLLARPSFTFYGVDLKASMDGWQVTGNIGYRF